MCMFLIRKIKVLNCRNFQVERSGKTDWLKGEKGIFQQGADAVTINLPDTLPDANDSVLVLELDGSAEDLPILKL